MLIKRRGSVFAEWTDEGFFLISPLDARTRLRVGERVFRLVESLSDWTPVDKAVELLAKGESEERQAALALELLTRYEIVVSDSPGPRERAPWSKFGSIAELYHQHSRDVAYVVGGEARRSVIDRIVTSPPPPSIKGYPEAKRIYLPRVQSDLSMSFERVIKSRRTHRTFARSELAILDLATVLQTAFGPQRFIDGVVFGTLQLRTSPNAGALQEIECYVAVLNVEGIPRGIYHYHCIEHSLEQLTEDLTRETLSNLCYDQDFAETVPVVCFTSAVTDRITYKYQDGRAYRLWLYNIGHVGQTFVLTAAALGLGSFQSAAFRDSEVDRLLGLDGNREFVTYMLAIGPIAVPDNSIQFAFPPPRSS